MIKALEKADGNSCLNKAREDELIFVLLERDPAASFAIRQWAEQRVRIGKNTPGDYQLREALKLADAMDEKREGHSA